MQGIQQVIKSQQMLKCPYDPNHDVPRQTFFKHLDKCKSPYKDLYAQCPFNPYHYPRKQIPTFRKHCKECPQRLRWLELQASKSQQYELLLQPDTPSNISSNLSTSMAQISLNSSTVQNQNLNMTSSWASQPKPLQRDDSIRSSQAFNNNMFLQSQVRQVNIPQNVQNSLYYSQMKYEQPNSFRYSQYNQVFMPPPPNYYYQPQYNNQYPPNLYEQEIRQHYDGQGYGYDSKWNEQETEINSSNSSKGRQKVKKQKKFKKEKKSIENYS